MSTGALTDGEARIRERGRKSFAMLPREIIESDLDDGCVRLFAYMLMAEGPTGTWPVTGATTIGDRLGMQANTVLVHAGHLRDNGLIAYERHGWGKYSFSVLYSPRRGLGTELCIPPARRPARKLSAYSKAHVRRGPAVSDVRSSDVTTTEDRGSGARTCPTKSKGQPKSTKYEEMSGQFELADDAMCGHPGCQEAVEGHTFGDHEPVPKKTPNTFLRLTYAKGFDPDKDYCGYEGEGPVPRVAA